MLTASTVHEPCTLGQLGEKISVEDAMGFGRQRQQAYDNICLRKKGWQFFGPGKVGGAGNVSG